MISSYEGGTAAVFPVCAATRSVLLRCRHFVGLSLNLRGLKARFLNVWEISRLSCKRIVLLPPL